MSAAANVIGHCIAYFKKQQKEVGKLHQPNTHQTRLEGNEGNNRWRVFDSNW